ncbi:MAG: hypothetical protein WDN28_12305 [Chthoniobacter sp.]
MSTVARHRDGQAVFHYIAAVARGREHRRGGDGQQEDENVTICPSTGGKRRARIGGRAAIGIGGRAGKRGPSGHDDAGDDRADAEVRSE